MTQSSKYQQIYQALPQTQCMRCGYDDCAAYAKAIDDGSADINLCPPGGKEGIVRLAKLTGSAIKPLNSQYGEEQARNVVWIDEDWCIGCTRCISVCPVDAIVGSNKVMHSVLEQYCTGCELCIDECPVDCMHTQNVTGNKTGWDAWNDDLANQAKQRYQNRSQRLQSQQQKQQPSKKFTLADLLNSKREAG